MARDGTLGEVHAISVGFTRNVLPGFRPTDATIDQAHFDWDLWLGPAPRVAFDPFRALYNFRWFWDYSGGQMTNFGAHHLDIARWVLAAKGPTTVAGLGGRYAIKDGGQTPDVQEVLYQFPGCVVTWSAREVNKGGRTFDLEIHGSKGTLGLTRQRLVLSPEKGNESGPPLEETGGNLDRPHIENFLACVKTRAHPNADIEEGHRTAVMCHLGNIATRLGRSLRWDPEKEVILGDAEASACLVRPYRKPWSLATI
jgi:predicted dehydrogenase